MLRFLRICAAMLPQDLSPGFSYSSSNASPCQRPNNYHHWSSSMHVRHPCQGPSGEAHVRHLHIRNLKRHFLCKYRYPKETLTWEAAFPMDEPSCSSSWSRSGSASGRFHHRHPAYVEDFYFQLLLRFVQYSQRQSARVQPNKAYSL